MIKIGQYYKHERNSDVCVRVEDILEDGKALVEWYNIGFTGKPWPIPTTKSSLYMHPDVWYDVTDLLSTPRKDWPK